MTKPVTPVKALYTSLTGLSPVVAGEMLYRASLSDRTSTDSLSEMEQLHLYRNVMRIIDQVKESFHPDDLTKTDMPVEFSSTI